MAAPSLSITKLSEDDRRVILKANISNGGTVDASNLVLATASDYIVDLTAETLSINRVWFSLDGFSVNLKFEADTPVKALTLTGNGSYDLDTILGIKNPGGSGSTGNILLDTVGIATTGNPGSIIIELRKVQVGELGGTIDTEATSSLFTPEVPEVSGGIVIGGNATEAGYITLLEDSDNGTDGITLQAPASIASDFTLVLPNADGSADQILKTDGSGNLSWVDMAGGLDEWTAASASGGSLLKFYEDTDGGTNYIALQGPDTAAADVTFKLPIADGTTGQILKTDGSGQLGWVDNTAGESEETGYWTPGYISSGGGDSITYDAGSWVPKGHYRKIGSIVTCVFELATDSWSGASGSYIYLTGLPFTPLKASSSGGEGNQCAFGVISPYSWNTNGPTFVQYQSTYVYLEYVNAYTPGYISPSNINSSANANACFGTLVYTTSE